MKRSFVFVLLVVITLVGSPSVQAQSPWQNCSNWLARASSPRYWLNSGPYVAVVDPLSSGRFLAERLTAMGYRVLAVHSTPNIIPVLKDSYRPASVAKDLFPTEEMNATQMRAMAVRLSAFQSPNVSSALSLKAIFNGSEGGTVLTDYLTDALGMDGNDPALSLTKRDKGLMHQRLAALGVPHISHLRSKSLDEVLHWIYSTNQGRFPVVLKPVDSAATQGVSICENETEVRTAFLDLMNPKSENVFNHRIDEVLVQEFLEGVEENSEYVINTASSEGRHIVTDVIRYRKRKVLKANGSHAIVYLFDEFLPINDPVVLRMREYAFQVLDATGVKFGPAHMEIMLTPRGPVLVEIGARPAGSGLPQVAAKAYPHHPLDLTIYGYLNRDRFKEIWEKETAHPGSEQRLTKHARQVEFISPREGYLVGLPLVDKLKQLRSYVSHSLSVRVGEKLKATEDLITSPGHVELAHEDPQVVQQDYEQLRAWEQGEFFQVSSVAPVPTSSIGFDMLSLPFNPYWR